MVGCAFSPRATAEVARAAARSLSGPCFGLEAYGDGDFAVAVASRFAPDEDSASFGEIHQDERYVVASEGYALEGDVPAGSSCSERRGQRLLKAFLAQGTRGLARIPGALTIAIWDKREKELVLYAPRYGQRWLFSRPHGASVAFSSEIKALPLIDGRPLELDDVGFSNALANGVTYGSRTCFRNVERFFLGGLMRLSPQGRRRELPFLLPLGHGPQCRDLEQAVDELDELLARSTRRLLAVCRSRAVLSSMGVDSSLVASIYKRVSGDLLAITQNLPDTQEAVGAARIAEHLGGRHHAVDFRLEDRSIIDELDAVIQLTEEPMWMSVGPVQLQLCREASDLASAFFTGAATDSFLGPQSGCWDEERQELGNYVLRPYSLHQIQSLYSIDLVSEDDFVEMIAPHLGEDPEKRCSVSYWAGIMDRVFLHMGLRIAAATGSEILNPFLDDEVVDFSFRLPSRLKEDPETGEVKVVVRRLLERYVPSPLLAKRKYGLWANIVEWGCEDGSLDPILDTLSDSRCLDRGIYDKAALSRLIEKYRSGQAGPEWHNVLWQVLSGEVFLRRFIDSDRSELATSTQ